MVAPWCTVHRLALEVASGRSAWAHTVSMQELWPEPSPQVAEVIRAVCQRLLLESDALVEALHGPALLAQNDPALLADPSLVEEDRLMDRSDLLQWLTSNVQRPGRRVEPYVGPRAAAYISDLVSRGIAPDFVEGWRAGLGIGWRRWLEECAAHCADRELLVEVLDVSGTSLVQYAMDSISALREANLGAAKGHADAEAISLIQMIANGAPLADDFAESRLNYRMARWHLGLVMWVDEQDQVDTLEATVTSLRSGLQHRGFLVARASATSRWVWVSETEAPDVRRVATLLPSSGPVRVSAGRTGRSLDGFRSSHLDALAGQSLLMRLGSRQAFTEYADVELIDSLTRDRDSARRFVRNTLGPLADADDELQRSLLVYLQSGFNTTRAAARLYAHRNTVERRVTRANELSRVKVEDNPTYVAAALMVLDLAPDLLGT